TVTARYVLAADCGTTLAGTAGTGSCGASNSVNVVIFPSAPAAPIVNSGFGPIIVTPPSTVSGFTIQYSFDDGATWGANTPPTNDNCTGYKIKTRYVTAAACGSIPSGTSSTIAACKESPATTRIVDQTAPINITVSANPSSLWPPNHKMKDIKVTMSAQDNCSATGAPICRVVSITSNEPINNDGSADGNTEVDWEIPTNPEGAEVWVKLRAERSGNGDGRVYTINVECTDAAGNTSQSSTTVTVAHNISGPGAGSSVKIGTTINMAGTFWDVAGNKHTAKWLVDGASVNGTVASEPVGTKNGTVKGSYKLATAGVYKLQMNITDQKGVTSYATTNGYDEAIVVAYDPNGGYTYGGKKYKSPKGAFPSQPNVAGDMTYGFQTNYYKGATNPKGETWFILNNGEFEFNALNFDYLVVNGAKAQFKGLGKMVRNGVEQSGIAFILTVIDGQLTGGGGADKIRMKIYNKSNGEVYYDSQAGASDADNPTTVVENNAAGDGVVVVNTNTTTTAARINTAVTATQVDVTPQTTYFDLKASPNPTTSHFTVKLESPNTKDPITMKVMDLSGKVIEIRKNLVAGQTFQLGTHYRPGMYFAELTQGDKRRIVKLVKQPD
ncbi:MAG: T9SS type A sorting domain-containing protein, partial [Gloeobacteraceae cyanobacterium ES-bin-316]|nr:T9SS type A sorting domain-containing protein [Ferruginibacter sp.]